MATVGNHAAVLRSAGLQLPVPLLLHPLELLELHPQMREAGGNFAKPPPNNLWPLGGAPGMPHSAYEMTQVIAWAKLVQVSKELWESWAVAGELRGRTRERTRKKKR